jgi:hypothetical protein
MNDMVPKEDHSIGVLVLKSDDSSTTRTIDNRSNVDRRCWGVRSPIIPPMSQPLAVKVAMFSLSLMAFHYTILKLF